jgi:uncharacterized protein (DUF433 family)
MTVLRAAAELKGRLSNPSTRQKLRTIDDLMAGTPVVKRDRPAVRSVRSMRVRDRLSETDVDEILSQFVAGMTRQALVERYGISLSSVKRLLRRYGVRR